MADPRDLAVRWLAEVLDSTMDRLISPANGPALARAILDQPGVEVDGRIDWGFPARIAINLPFELTAGPLDGGR